MKIIEIIPQLSQGGAERFVIDLCNHLCNKHQIVLIVLHKLDNYGFFLKELNSEVKIKCMNKHMGMDWQLFRKLYHIIKKEEPDIVHTHLRACIYTFYSSLKYKKARYYHTIHSQSPQEADGKLGLLLRKIAFKLHLMSPITISEDSQLSFEKTYGISSTLIYNGRPPFEKNTTLLGHAKNEIDSFRHTPQSIIVVNVARIDTAKNQYALSQAIHELNIEQNINIELLIIGRKENADIIQKIESLQSPYIHLLGERKEPRYYMASADAFCLPSLYEGMPITLIECFSVGCLPLCTPVGGINNMIADGENGLLATGCDKNSIKKLLLHYCSLSKHEKTLIKQQSEASYSKYTMETCASAYEHLFKDK